MCDFTATSNCSSSSSSSSSSGGDRRKRRQSRSKSRSIARKLDSKEKDGKDVPKSRERARLSSERDGSKRRGSSAHSKSKDITRRSRDRSRSRSTSVRRKREKSPTPRPARIHIGRLTRNVTKEHILEIFGSYGEIKNVEFPTDRFHPNNNRGFCYVEFMNPDDAESAMKHMDGGQIDGQEVTAAPVLNLFRPTGMRRSPMRRGPPPMRNRWRGGGDMRNRRNDRRSPDRRDRRRESPRRR